MSRAKALTVFDFDGRGYGDKEIISAPLTLSQGAFTLVFEDLNTSTSDFAYQVDQTGSLNYQASGELAIQTEDASEVDMQSIDLGFTDSQVSASTITITGYRNGSQVAQVSTASVVGGSNTTISLSATDAGFLSVDRVVVNVNSITGGEGIASEFTTFDDVAVDDPAATNTAPTVVTNTGSTVNEGANDVITQTELETTDSEQGASSLTYTIDADVTEGNLFNGSTQIDQSDTFTQADINNDNIEYRHDGSEPVSGVGFDFTVADGAGASDSGTFSLTITSVNDAPTISALSDQLIQEDGTLGPVDVTVDDVETSDLSTLIVSGTSDNTTLVPESNISVTGPDTSGNASITVDPAANESGSAMITVTVDDGAGANSTASETFELTVIAVPDLAIADGSALGFSGSVDPGTSNNPVGKVKLSVSQTGASFRGGTITNSNDGVEGVTAVRLFVSADDVFEPGSDTQIGSDVTVDPSGAPSTLTFSGATQALSADTTVYVFLAIDVEAGAPAQDVLFSVADPSDLSTDGEVATVNGQNQSTFSALPLSSSATTLPVELAGFEAQLSGEAVTLTWQTASETGNAGFRVQRHIMGGVKASRRDASTRMDDWQTVGAVEGAGTTTRARSYRFEDADLPYEADSLTYRLKQVDTDGSVSYSDAVTVARSGVNELRLSTYPNPARSRATVRLAVPEGSASDPGSGSGQGVTLRLYDVLGRQVQTLRAEAMSGRHTLVLDTGRLPSGTYFLRLWAGGTTTTQQVTVVQ